MNSSGSSSELTRRHLRAGDRIFAEGDPGDVAYVIERGEVAIFTSCEGEERCVAVLAPGQLLGEMAILDGASRSASAVARQDTELIVVDRERLEARLVGVDPVVRLAMLGLLERLRAQIHRPLAASSPVSHSGSFNQATLDRLRLENELGAALIDDGLSLHLQPVFELATREIRGFEALVRWEHPQRGPLPPSVFVPLAEESGLIRALGRWMLGAACRAASLLDARPNRAGVQGRGAFVSVNVSTVQFRDPSFLAALELSLGETGLEGSRLKLEVTESALSDPDTARAWIARCKALGARVSLDDFGTGYSSLSYLHDLAIDEIKVDQRFVRQAAVDPRSARVVEAILTLANGLGLDTVCEGLEHEQQVQRMMALGCRYGQGYLLAPPVPIEELLV